MHDKAVHAVKFRDRMNSSQVGRQDNFFYRLCQPFSRRLLKPTRAALPSKQIPRSDHEVLTVDVVWPILTNVVYLTKCPGTRYESRGYHVLSVYSVHRIETYSLFAESECGESGHS